MIGLILEDGGMRAGGGRGRRCDGSDGGHGSERG